MGAHLMQSATSLVWDLCLFSSCEHCWDTELWSWPGPRWASSMWPLDLDSCFHFGHLLQNKSSISTLSVLTHDLNRSGGLPTFMGWHQRAAWSWSHMTRCARLCHAKSGSSSRISRTPARLQAPPLCLLSLLPCLCLSPSHTPSLPLSFSLFHFLPLSSPSLPPHKPCLTTHKPQASLYYVDLELTAFLTPDWPGTDKHFQENL